MTVDFSAPDAIIIDADDTNADTYGAQQLTLFNAYYGEYCYMSLLLFEGRSGKLILPITSPGYLSLTLSPRPKITYTGRFSREPLSLYFWV